MNKRQKEYARRAKKCGLRIHYWGKGLLGETWILDGITPITEDRVRYWLKERERAMKKKR